MTTPPHQPEQTPPPYPVQPYSPHPYPPIAPQPVYVVQAPQPPTSTFATVSLIFGILGLVVGCCTFGVFSIVAVLAGHAALKDIKENGTRGDGMAKAGLVMGYLLVVPMILFSFWMVVGAGMEAVNPSSP
jgi:hypothetical protein